MLPLIGLAAAIGWARRARPRPGLAAADAGAVEVSQPTTPEDPADLTWEQLSAEEREAFEQAMRDLGLGGPPTN